MKRLRFGTIASLLIAFNLAAAAVFAAQAQTYTSVVTFNGQDGGSPSGITQAFDGNFYGGTSEGGKHGQNNAVPGDGTIFRVTPTDTLVSLYSFCSQAGCADGAAPEAPLTQAAAGNFYGTTFDGGSFLNCGDGCGTIFKTDGQTLTTLYTFCTQGSGGACPDGFSPQSQLVQARNGNLYGTTLSGGSYSGVCGFGCGTVFEITPQGTFTTLHSFCQSSQNSRCLDGYAPMALLLGTDGNLYGATEDGGNGKGSKGAGCASGCGTIFRITPEGELSTLYNFCAESSCSEGWGPIGITQGVDGNLYGTTFAGGANGEGTVFKFTTGGQLIKLYDFCSQSNCTDGGDPGAIIQGTDGNLYGITYLGGLNNNSSVCGSPGCGTIFQISPAGNFTSLYSFCSQPNCADGYSVSSLMQATNGNFYGTTYLGGTSANCVYGETCGTVFSLDMGLGPFVKTNPGSGQVGWNINVFGYSLTGTTAVSFNGTPATSFTVESDTLIKATVPSSATSGTIQVTTPSGTLSSNVPFNILP